MVAPSNVESDGEHKENVAPTPNAGKRDGAGDKAKMMPTPVLGF